MSQADSRALTPFLGRYQTVTSFKEKDPAKDLASCCQAAALRCLKREKAAKLKVLPIAVVSVCGTEHLSVASAAEKSSDELKELQFLAGLPLLVEVSEDPRTISRAIKLAYWGSDAAISTKFFDSTSEVEASQVLERIIARALFLKASDIHIEPTEVDYRLRLRVDGLLQVEQSIRLTADLARAIIRRIQVLANLPLLKPGSAQDGAFSYQTAGWRVRLRFSTLSQLFGPKIVMRLLEMGEDSVLVQSPQKEEFLRLGLSKQQTLNLLSSVNSHGGLILLSGPTGSGKSTLLSTLLRYLNSESKNCVSIEDPVETLIPGVNQIEKGPEASDFKDMLRAVVRQDPDVLMIGEIRDEETAKLALDASLAGSLVFSTIHASHVFQILERMRRLGSSNSSLSAALRILMSQRLLRELCSTCSELVPASAEVQHYFALNASTRVARAYGCEKCSDGVSGRVAVFECLGLTTAMTEGIESGVSVSSLMRMAAASKFKPMCFAVRELLCAGRISAEEGMRALGV